MVKVVIRNGKSNKATTTTTTTTTIAVITTTAGKENPDVVDTYDSNGDSSLSSAKTKTSRNDNDTD